MIECLPSKLKALTSNLRTKGKETLKPLELSDTVGKNVKLVQPLCKSCFLSYTEFRPKAMIK
jgi:hypothetical protein